MSLGQCELTTRKLFVNYHNDNEEIQQQIKNNNSFKISSVQVYLAFLRSNYQTFFKHCVVRYWSEKEARDFFFILCMFICVILVTRTRYYYYCCCFIAAEKFHVINKMMRLQGAKLLFNLPFIPTLSLPCALPCARDTFRFAFVLAKIVWNFILFDSVMCVWFVYFKRESFHVSKRLFLLTLSRSMNKSRLKKNIFIIFCSFYLLFECSSWILFLLLSFYFVVWFLSLFVFKFRREIKKTCKELLWW